MAKNDSDDNDDAQDGDDPVGDQIAKGAVRLEVVAEPDQLALATRSTRLATGMFVGTLLCLPQIFDAATGQASFEATLIRLLMLLAASVTATIGLGSLLDTLTEQPGSPAAAAPAAAAMTDEQDQTG